MTRTCGNCQVCCTLLAVPGMNKPERTRCERLCRDGCGDYGARPEDCQGYSCSWLLDPEVPASWRPDRLGVVFDTALEEALVPMARGLPWVVAREVSPGSFLTPKAKKAIHAVSGSAVVFLAHWTPGTSKLGLVAPASFREAKPLPVVAS